MSSGVSFIPIGIAICYCYMTLRESNKLDIIRQWYELNLLESLAIIYCVVIGSIRTNWFLFVTILNLAIIVCLAVLGWHLLYNFEELKNMVINQMRQNSLLEVETRDIATDSAIKNEEEQENKDEIETETALEEEINYIIENSVEQSFSDIDKNLDNLVPEINKIIENINVDANKLIESVEMKGEKSSTIQRTSDKPEINSEQLFTELERITDNLVRDTKKIADNVCLVSSMIVENSQIDLRRNMQDEEVGGEEVEEEETPQVSKASPSKLEKLEKLEKIELVNFLLDPVGMLKNNKNDTQETKTDNAKEL